MCLMCAEVTGKGPAGLWEERREAEPRFLTPELVGFQCQYQFSSLLEGQSCWAFTYLFVKWDCHNSNLRVPTKGGRPARAISPPRGQRQLSLVSKNLEQSRSCDLATTLHGSDLLRQACSSSLTWLLEKPVNTEGTRTWDCCNLGQPRRKCWEFVCRGREGTLIIALLIAEFCGCGELNSRSLISCA